MAGCDREKLLCAEKTPDSLESAARYILNCSTFAVIHWLGNPREASIWVKQAIDLKKQVVVFDLDSI